jgi:hypothetical protein
MAKLYFRQEQDIFLYSTASAPYKMGTGRSFPGVKRPRSEADNSPPSRAKVKNSRSIPPPPTSSWCGALLIKHRDNFIFTLQLY